MNPQAFQTFLGRLRGELSRLPHSHQLAFGASCCERAYPNYRVFVEQEGWGDIAGLRSALNAVWDFVVSGNLTEGDWAALLARCKTATPDSTNFSPLTKSASAVITAAQEAGFMVTLLLEFCTDPDPNYGTRIASFARDTVDQHVQALKELNPTDPRFEEKIAEHPLLIQELREQQEDLAILRETTALDGLKQFRQRASNPKQSNIGLIPRAPT